MTAAFTLVVAAGLLGVVAWLALVLGGWRLVIRGEWDEASRGPANG